MRRRRRCLALDSPPAEGVVLLLAASEADGVGLGFPRGDRVLESEGLREDAVEGEGDVMDDPASLAIRFAGA